MSFKNPFALLADEDHSGDEAPLAKSSKPTQVDAAPPAGNANKAQSGRIPNASTRRSVPGQTVVKQTQAKELPPSDAPAGAGFEKENSRDDRAQGRGGRGRGGRGGAARGADRRAPRGERPPRTERPDRHSATGKTDSAKQEHQGWGGDEGKRELDNENAGVTDAAAEKATGESTETDGAAATPAADAAPAPAEEEIDNTQSYEEYLAARKAAGNTIEGVQDLQVRKANEGQDESQWKDGVVVSKDKSNIADDVLFPGQAKEKSVRQRQRKEKNTLETEIYFAPVGGERRGGRGGARGGASSGGRGRGEGRGRGGNRGGAPRTGGPAGGAPRGGRSNGVNVEDSSAFPALGA